ncbi:2-oxo acid dehydrogenase subunit E2 [Streptomyces sp. NBC_01476]|uniref:dihydrolipoamide acetyltransferase family protein n=1 Tax=Streptomyces sp. NBC_01476 TaxID=2903881 RepID=UPI002E33CD1B|nr:dihydrolipoamide acetyltransferase family protein [Streptomyces sp. NBC_01476]
MAAVKEFTLPDLGEGLTEAEIVRWLVRVGDVVAVDQPVVEVETAKAVVEVPCPYGGVVTARFGAEGETLAVGRPLVTVAVGQDAGAGQEPAGDGGGSAQEGSGNVLVGYGTGPATTRRRNRVRAVSAVVAREPVTVTAADGRSPQGVPAAAHPDGGPVAVISPLVRRLARERGLDLRSVRGTGPDGLILRADVERTADGSVTAGGPVTADGPAADGPVADGLRAGGLTADGLAADRFTADGLTADGFTADRLTADRFTADGLAADRLQETVSAPAAPASALGREGAERVPLRGMRGAVAEKLSRSRREIPDATCWVDADATELLAARAAMNAAGQAAGAGRISVLAFFARITTAALARHPELNATVDTGRNEIIRLPAVHLGFAAQTERGLVVPVVRDAQSRTTAGLSAEIRRLTDAARAGSLTPGELTGGTFTLNNYGVFGVDGSTPIINHPEAAMLGVGRIVAKPWVHQGELAVRQVVQLSFTFDHRVCDGGTAGGFLRFVADCVENPAVLLSAV